jgi:F-type H+-transporting ATPase subunit epsilon
MSPIRLDVVTAERQVYILIAPGIEGQLGILPHHVPLMTTLAAGEMLARKGENEIVWAISGGFLEVQSERIIVLADAAERDDEIDLQRAEKARQRAEARLKERTSSVDTLQAEAALQRSLARLKVGQRQRRRRDLPSSR